MLRAEMKLSHEALDDEGKRRRETEMRLDLYRAIYRGDMEKAEDMANMLAMIDIDRDLIFQAKGEVRRG